MKSLTTGIGALFLAAVGLASAQSPAPTIDSYISDAKVAAGMDWAGTFLRLCVPPPAGARRRRGGPRPTPERETWYARPQKVADNLYFIGTRTHNSWALVGSEGIIVIEALYAYAAKDEVLDGLKSLGLDPANVKYVILSHAHGDHDGGAKMLQDQIPGVQLIYGAEDWDLAESQPDRSGGVPKRNKIGDDGMNVSVGDASVRIVTMPGHTEGTLSYLFEVKDNGQPLRVAYVGGTAIPFNGSAELYDRYIASSKKMGDATTAYGATVLLSNHTEFDKAYLKAHLAASRHPGEQNPFDVGQDGVARYFTVVQACASAAKLRAAGE
ncbi:MAG: MBL fold metallo-hydrolase [Acidobacteria bacterium]|nr:MBL fold metallo-hydrolase [Acidobacteriota bacterium]MDA1236232.1 MBL fold metallo-hydrolase [Acidobacteriota bacterium]